MVEGLDRVGEVLEDGHGGGELLGELGVGSLPTTPTGTAGDRQSGGGRRRFSSSCATAPSPGAARGGESDPIGTVGGRQPGEGREMLGSSAIVPSPGAEGEDWSNSIAIEILFLILVKHDSMKSRSSRISPGSGRKPALDW